MVLQFALSFLGYFRPWRLAHSRAAHDRIMDL